MPMNAPGSKNHSGPCERATLDGCVCDCDGMLHQNSLLIAAVASDVRAEKYAKELTKVFGSDFSHVSRAPGTSEEVRRGSWTPVTLPLKAGMKSQMEKRIVDVALREVLRIVQAVPTRRKNGWKEFVDALTMKEDNKWRNVSRDVFKVVRSHDTQSGYYWASMLAATSGCAAKSTNVDVAGISGFMTATNSGSFERVVMPRGRTGSSVRTIKEIDDLRSVVIGARAIEAAWNGSRLPDADKVLLTRVVGSAVSADLWRHPVAVRHLLLPAVEQLRTFGSGVGSGATFSLDASGVELEEIIQEELGDKWKVGGFWGGG